MDQILKNYLLIFAAPFLVGIALRLLGRRAKRGFLISAGLITLAGIGWSVYGAVPSHGSERYGIAALAATSAAAGALLAGLVIWLRRKQ